MSDVIVVFVVVAQQVLTSMRIIMGLDGTDIGRKRIQQLADNAKYFRQALKKRGFIIYGLMMSQQCVLCHW